MMEFLKTYCRSFFSNTPENMIWKYGISSSLKCEHTVKNIEDKVRISYLILSPGP